MNNEQLKLENQLCFPFYAISRLITRAYQPYLDKLGITYPQYLVMLVLWENDGLAVNKIAKKLILKTNTITPLLKRLEHNSIIEKRKSTGDDRKVLIYLTSKGVDMKSKAQDIPRELITNLDLNLNNMVEMKNNLKILLSDLNK